jgi:hypothetical protein
MLKISPERRAAIERAEIRARAIIKPGDWICDAVCLGKRRRFKFTHWEGPWLCGRSVSDCLPAHVTKINGQPVDLTAVNQ